MSSGLAAERLAAGYRRDEPAIVDVTFRAGRGEAIAVLGPNGGGKTTLLRALLGELPFSSGAVERDERVAYVPQTERSRLDFPVSALDVSLMGTYARLPWHGRVGRRERAVAGEALARVGLADVARQQYGSLSGGQRQRVLVARALAQEAEVLLLDEPLSGVDRASGQRILALLDELRHEGRTLMVATHELSEARRFDAVLCLNRRQVAFGPPDAALRPAVLEQTYGEDMVILETGGQPAVAVLARHRR